MRAVVGVVALDDGEVRWRGAPVDPQARRAFGYMPEERGLYPGMVVLEQLEYLGRLHGLSASDARDSARHWTERLGVADKAHDKLEALSQGNQQRVQLAAALVHDPELLVLDEPFSGLDPVGVDAMSDVLAERAAEGATVLFSSHQLDLVENICKSVAIIHRGRLVAEGDVEDLRRSGQPRLAVSVAGDPEGHWAEHVAWMADVEQVQAGTVLLALAPGADAQAVLDAARAAGPVEHFAFERRRLSEIFREAVGARLEDVDAEARAHTEAAAAQKGRQVMSRDWFEPTWLVALRELRQGARARSFRIVTIVLVLAVAAAVVIPAAVRGRHTVRRSASSAARRPP